MDINLSIHNFNEKLGRLEPKYTLCEFCKRKHSQSMEDNYFVTVYKVNNRLLLVIYNSVKFNKIDIGISRCSGCKAIHDKAQTITLFLIFLITAFLVYTVSLINIVFGIFSIFIGLLINVLINHKIEDSIVKSSDILSKREGIENNLLVAEFLFKDWSLKKPSP